MLEQVLQAIDWHDSWLPSVRLLLAGHSPYENGWFLGPPWALFPFVPFAYFPEVVGRVFLFVLCLMLLALTALRLGGRRLAFVAFLLSPPVMEQFATGNLDAFVLFGLVLPHWLGLFFISIKPQIGLPVALIWAVEAWREGGVKQLARTFGPVGMGLLVSFTLYGLWPLDPFTRMLPSGVRLVDVPWNASLWPWSLVPGVLLLALALYRKNDRLAAPVGPCLSPYLAYQSWSAALVPLIERPVLLVMVSAGLWVLTIWSIL